MKITRYLYNLLTAGFSSLSVQRSILLPAFELVRKKPVNLKSDEENYFKQEFKKNFSFVTKAVVKNARLLVNEGLVVKGFHIISESLMHESVRNWYGPGFINRAYRSNEILPPGKYLFVYNHYGVGYGHWLADILPRLFLIKDQLKEYKIILPENYNTFHIKSLLPLGVAKNDIQYVKLHSVYKIPKLTLISHIGSSCNTKDEVLQDLREFYLNYYIGSKRTAPYRKLYISRSKMKHRKVINEQEIEKLLIENGFEILYPEDHNFEEQVKLFSECKVMISLTGSGLTNMLFMPAGGSVVEFKMEGDYTNLHYFSMASGMQLDYYYLLCKVNGNDRFTADYYVEISKMQLVIDKLSKTV